VWTLDGADWKM